MIRIMRCFYNYKVYYFFKRCFKVIYSQWIKLEFAECGKHNRFGKFRYLHEPDKAFIGNNVAIGDNVVIEIYSTYLTQTFSPKLEIGNNSSMGDDGHITCINHIKIGNNVLMGRKVFITDNAHGASKLELLSIPPNLRPLHSKGPIIIEDNVWIGEMVCIMPGVTIGYGSIIGANAVVTKDIPPYCVAVGNPAQIIKQLNKNA